MARLAIQQTSVHTPEFPRVGSFSSGSVARDLTLAEKLLVSAVAVVTVPFWLITLPFRLLAVPLLLVTFLLRAMLAWVLAVACLFVVVPAYVVIVAPLAFVCVSLELVQEVAALLRAVSRLGQIDAGVPFRAAKRNCWAAPLGLAKRSGYVAAAPLRLIRKVGHAPAAVRDFLGRLFAPLPKGIFDDIR